jgi:hypothetical protein
MQNQTILGTFSHVPQDVTDYPLLVIGNELPDSFLSEEVAFGVTAGKYFYTSDLATMWRDITFVKVLMKHPEAIGPLKAVARRLKVKVQPIKIKDFFHVLNVTDEYLFENQVDTIEDLVTKIASKKIEIPDDLVKNDLDSLFRSFYGVGLDLTA